MKARIINGVEFGRVFTNEFLEENLDKTVNGQLVSEWQLTEILPNPTYKQPEWTGSEWVEAYVETIEVSNEVHNFKFRLALIHFGVLPSSIDLAISQIQNSTVQEQLYSLWNFAPVLERNDNKLIGMATQFEIDSQTLDQIFLYANSI